LALAAGGNLMSFFRPIKNLRWLIRERKTGTLRQRWSGATRDFITALRLKHLFWLGLRGYAGALLWLVLPTFLFAAADKTEGGAFVVTVVGGVGLALIFAWLPFLQARFACENRLGAMFELGTIRQTFRRAPIAWLLALAVVYTLALPLYLLKVVLPPRDAMWFITIVFIVSICPAKLVTGWAYFRATNRTQSAWRGWRWLARIVMVPLLSLYVFALFFTQFIGEHGKRVLFEHHAFLLPVPF
jgi:hypothetical protein